MPGFPARPSRLALSPLTLRNRFSVQESDMELGAVVFMLAFWQIAGCGLVVPKVRAQLIIDNAGDETLGFSAEAWDPEGAAIPAISKQATGHYRLVYAATYNDEAGNPVAPELEDAVAHVQLTSTAVLRYLTWCLVDANKRQIDVYVTLAATPAVLADPVDQNIVVVGY